MKNTSNHLFWFAIICFALGLLAMLSCQRAFAAGGVTGTLRGTVIDAQTNAPLVGVRISVVSGSGAFRTATDAHGFFTLLQVPTDTYTVTASKDGYIAAVVSGVTVLGDQTQSIGVVRLTPAPKTLGQVRIVARSAASAFQPTQTVDETTFVGRRVDQALGEKGSTNYNNLVLSAPGVIQNALGTSTLGAFSIRGSASVEIGYQFDGVDYRGNFFDENPNANYLNGIGGGHGAMQVVSGAGDATQGGIGAGVVNIIPGRGSFPGDGFVSFDVGSPYYDHGMAVQYGFGSKDGRYSDFFSARSDRSAPQIAPYGRDASDAGQFRGVSFNYDDDVLNNFYFRFGRDLNSELQVLTDWLDHRAFGEYGGLRGANFYPYDPFSYQQYQTDPSGFSMWGVLPGLPASTSVAAAQLAWYQSVIPYVQNVPTTFAPVTQPEELLYGPVNLLKVGFSHSFNPTTAMNVFFYNWGGLESNNITAGGGGNSQSLTTGDFFAGYNNVGGRRVGFQTQFTKQLGQIHTLSLVAKFENGFPYWNQPYYANTWVGFQSARGQDASNFSLLGINPSAASCPTIQVCVNGPRVEDWYLPQIPGQPVGPGNPCIGPAADNGFNPTGSTVLGCYIYSWMLAHGKWNGRLPAIPLTGFTYAGTDFQQYGIGIRDQWAPNNKLHVDYGVRLDGQYLRWGANQFTKDLGNTADVGLGYATLGNDYLRPELLEPRIAIDYVLNPANSVRLSYGRSVSLYFAQTAGTPTTAIIDPLLYQIPAKDNGSPLGPACGSGWHGPGTNGNGTYQQSPYVPFSGAGVLNTNGWYFLCPSYASSVYWLFDQTFAAPDIGGGFPATYNNWDLAWEHQFPNGWGTKLTSYWRRGYDTYQVTLLNNGPPDPVTGAENSGSFQVKETGIQKTFGLEFYMTTPDKPQGISGFLTMNYVNELTNTPPVSGSDSLPVVSQFLYQTNTLFHQSYLPPFSARSGIEYRTRSGWRVNPIFAYDNGIPFGVGRDAIGFINGILYHLPTGNVGVATPYAGPGNPNQSINATCYVDPAFPGSYFNPKDFACRGYDEPALAGQKYTRARMYGDLDLQYEKGWQTYGVYIFNVFNNFRGEPGVNQAWEPVSDGQAGLQTGQFAGAYPLNPDGTPNAFYYQGARDISRYDEYWLPFNRLYVPGTTLRFYAQFKI